MNNTKVKEMIKFSFYKNIQNKWFIIFNVITLLSIIIMLNWSFVTSLFSKETDEQKIFEIAVIDNYSLVYSDLVNELSSLEEFSLSKITENTYTSENIPNNFAIVEITPDEVEGFRTSIISKEGIKSTIYSKITDALYKIRNNLYKEKYNVTSDTLSVLQSELSINRVMLAVNAENSNIKELIKLFSSAITYLITILIFSKMANEIAQEKQSKSSEYILTTVSEKEYLFAKIFSNISILLIQGLLLFVYYFIAIGFTNIINIATTDITLNTGFLTNNISLDTILYIVSLLIYNILNLILLCIIQATLSAKTASTSEAGNTVSILVFLMMAAYIATIYIITPYTKVTNLLYVISCIPILSAYFVPAMMVIGQATTLQIVISLGILIISIPLTFNFCSHIFKNGILDYTKVKIKREKIISESDKQKKFLMKREMKNVGFVVGLAILLYVGSQAILSLLGNFILPPLLNKYFTDTDITLILQMILQTISLGLSSMFVFAYCDKKHKNEDISNDTHKKTSMFSKFKIVLIALLLIFTLQILLSGFIYPKLGLDYDITDMFDVNANSNIISKLILVLALAVTPAIFEELFFRKALLDFSIKYGKNFALIFSALLFGLIHMNLSQGIFAFIIGIIFGAIYIYTKDIKLTILIHFINNGFAAFTMILPDLLIVLLTLILIAFLITGFVFLILSMINKNSRKKVKSFLTSSLSLTSIKNKYIYIFTDFTFDVSVLLVLVMSILTENILR